MLLRNALAGLGLVSLLTMASCTERTAPSRPAPTKPANAEHPPFGCSEENTRTLSQGGFRYHPKHNTVHFGVHDKGPNAGIASALIYHDDRELAVFYGHGRTALHGSLRLPRPPKEALPETYTYRFLVKDLDGNTFRRTIHVEYTKGNK